MISRLLEKYKFLSLFGWPYISFGQSHQHIYICAYLNNNIGKKNIAVFCYVNCRWMTKQTSNLLVKCMHCTAFLTTSHWTPFMPSRQWYKSRPSSHCPVLIAYNCSMQKLDSGNYCCNNTTYITKFNFSVNYKDLNRTFVLTPLASVL